MWNGRIALIKPNKLMNEREILWSTESLLNLIIGLNSTPLVSSDKTKSTMRLTTVFQHFKITLTNPRGCYIIHEFMQLSSRIHLTPRAGVWWKPGVRCIAAIHAGMLEITLKYLSFSHNKVSHLLEAGPERLHLCVYCCLVSCGTNNMAASLLWGQRMLFILSCLRPLWLL